MQLGERPSKMALVTLPDLELYVSQASVESRASPLPQVYVTCALVPEIGVTQPVNLGGMKPALIWGSGWHSFLNCMPVSFPRGCCLTGGVTWATLIKDQIGSGPCREHRWDGQGLSWKG